MKSVLSAITIFSLISIMTSCYSSPSESTKNETSLTAAFTTAESTTVTTTHHTTTAAKTSVCLTTTPSTYISTVSMPDYDSAEMSMLEGVGDPNYNGKVAVPYVAWTEVNLDKIMYPVSQCIGYEFALEDASPKMKYDAGIALEVIARTSTGYYRIKGDYYIPCDFLDTVIHDGIDASAATSCTVAPPPTAPPPAVTAVQNTALTSPK